MLDCLQLKLQNSALNSTNSEAGMDKQLKKLILTNKEFKNYLDRTQPLVMKFVELNKI
jgi:hypothetical protein